jgi:hypothetical protein
VCAVAPVRRFEQPLASLRASAHCPGTASFHELVYHLQDGLRQSGEPQAFIVGASSD